nr:reverse transcriptase domain-containing protein [Tanacetum cinerariifolium]
MNPRHIGPFKNLAKVRAIAYQLELPYQLSQVHNTFHVSNLKKCLPDETLGIPLDEIQIDDKLHFIKEPVEIIDREVKRLKQSCIHYIKWVDNKLHKVMERTFVSQKGSGVGRGIKEKSLNMSKTNNGIGLSMASDGTRNKVGPVSDTATVMKGVTPSMIDMTVENDKLSSLESSYANITSKSSGKKMNVRTLFTPGGKKVAYPVVVNYVRNTWGKYGLIRLMFSSSTGLFSFQFSSMDGLDAMLKNGPCEDGLSAISTKLGTPQMLDSYTSDNIVMAMPKITREGHYTCNVRVEYEWKPSRCSSCKVFSHIHEECTKNTGAGEKKTVMKPSQTSRGNGVVSTVEVSNSKPFDALNLVDNDGEFGTNGGTTNLVNNEANLSKLRLLDNNGNPLVPTGIVESDSKVDVVFDETANLRISTSGKDRSDKGYDTNSLLEQLRDSYPDNDDYDPYDDDMYENHDLSEHLQSVCDDLDIMVCGRKKK